MTLVSIATPTFPGREAELLTRCMPSVAALDWPLVEHVIVSDRNPGFAERVLAQAPVREGYTVRYAEINETWRNPTTEQSIGAVPWATASLLALGEFVGFLGDDDELLADHVARHVAAMEEAGADFSVSAIEFRVGGAHHSVIGNPTMSHGQLDATGIMCRISALQVAMWTANGENAADYRLVADWLRAGLKGHFIDGSPTGIHHDGWAAHKTGRPDRPR